jgi:hypothetical protein
MPTTPIDQPLEDIIAENMAAALSAATWKGPTTSFTAVVEEAPEWDHAEGDLDTLRVAVVPGPSMELTLRSARGSDKVRIDTGIMLAKAIVDRAERKALRALRTEIVEKIRQGALPVAVPSIPSWCSLVAVEIETAWDRVGVGGPRIFTCALRVVHEAHLA